MSQELTEKDPQDWFLDQLVEWANRYGVEMGITLNAGGMLVSGQTISGRNYFIELAKEFRVGKEEGSLVHTLGDLIEANKQIYEKYDLTIKNQEEGLETGHEAIADGEESDDSFPPPPTYIHLRDARIYAPGQVPIPGNRGVLWRGRLSEINGYSLGSLSAD